MWENWKTNFSTINTQHGSKGMCVFFWLSHIKVSVVQKIVRKRVILLDKKKVLIEPQTAMYFSLYLFRYQFWLMVFFSNLQDPEGKKKPYGLQWGREEIVCANQEKKNPPFAEVVDAIEYRSAHAFQRHTLVHSRKTLWYVTKF